MRLRILKNIIFSLFLVLFFDVFWIQIIKGPEYARQSETNRIRLVPEEASRGIIYDRNHVPLVKNKLVFDVVAVPQEIDTDNREALFSKLSTFLDIDCEVLADTFAFNSGSGFSPVMLVSDVPKATAFLIEQDADQLSGIFIKARAMRLYIHGRTTAHLIGYVGKMREDEYPELKKYGYRIKDVVGRSGLEKSFDKILRGKPGGMQLEVDSEGKIVNVLSYRPPVRGSDVHTTIDINLQQMLAELVGESKGAVVVMDADSGDILGMYSGPSFDPNVIIAKKNFIEIGKILKDTSAPLLNRNLKAYPAGSIFKIITAYAGLRERVIGIHDSFYCSGEFVIGNSTRHCWLRRGHGNVNIVRALTTSCNVFFWEVGLKVGQKMLSRYAEEFGLGKVTHVELNGEHSGLVPNARWKNTELHQRWYAGDTANFSIGQGYLLISPLQALQMVALLANGGREVRPHIVRRHDIPEKSKRILSQEVIAVINRGMRQVVNSVDGTGHRAFIEGEEVFAKTGTAQVANGTAHAWFIGYTVIERKKICFAVFLEHGGHGGERPAEIAKQIVMYVHETSRQQTSDTRHQTPQ